MTKSNGIARRASPHARPPGSWRRYYRRWAELTLDRVDPRLLDLVPRFAEQIETADSGAILSAWR